MKKTNENELTEIISYTREIETILKNKFQAEGKGLHTYLDAIENKIDYQLLKKLRYIATIRNKAMHDSSFKLNNLNYYKETAEKCIIELNKVSATKASQPNKKQSPIRNKRRKKVFNKHNESTNYRKKSYMPLWLIFLLLFLFSTLSQR